MKKLILLLSILFTAVLTAPWLLQAWVEWRVREQVYTPIDSIPPYEVALVLGAGLRRDGLPTAVLYDRVATAADLYKAGSVKKLLMSGDNRFDWHNEPAAMRQTALELGVPDEDIVLDYAGRRTYDSCYRARDIFGVKRLVVITQQFHLNRALYLCRAMGIEAIGVAADRRVYRAPARHFWQLREVAALVNAWLDINILRPQPVLGEKAPIELTLR